jgi:hypothetical protein
MYTHFKPAMLKDTLVHIINLPANAKVIKYGFISCNKVHRHHLHLHIHFKETKQNYTEDENEKKCGDAGDRTRGLSRPKKKCCGILSITAVDQLHTIS